MRHKELRGALHGERFVLIFYSVPAIRAPGG